MEDGVDEVPPLNRQDWLENNKAYILLHAHLIEPSSRKQSQRFIAIGPSAEVFGDYILTKYKNVQKLNSSSPPPPQNLEYPETAILIFESAQRTSAIMKLADKYRPQQLRLFCSNYNGRLDVLLDKNRNNNHNDKEAGEDGQDQAEDDHHLRSRSQTPPESAATRRKRAEKYDQIVELIYTKNWTIKQIFTFFKERKDTVAIELIGEKRQQLENIIQLNELCIHDKQEEEQKYVDLDNYDDYNNNNSNNNIHDDEGYDQNEDNPQHPPQQYQNKVESVLEEQNAVMPQTLKYHKITPLLKDSQVRITRKMKQQLLDDCDDDDDDKKTAAAATGNNQ